ncbi:peptidylprolyl isomerase [Candidatus Leptofilum sp.]|uniref:peptidylprolyl isomerase n=1 Tax=Candidatus Leptofilum sp. TaxID=3241576 RepID=UPI003B599604
MAKQRRSTPSRAARREAAAKKKAAHRRLYMTIGGVVAVLFIALIAWQLWPEPEAEPAAESVAATTLDGERPLANLTPAERNNYFNAPPEMIIDTSKTYEAIIVTEKGDMRLRLFDDEAPITVNNFVFLASQGFYDGTIFHRVLEDFMAQAGDPTGTGRGGPGYQFQDEFDNDLAFDRRGLLAMANAGPGTNGSQFFITFNAEGSAHLTGRHTIFGEIIEGDDVLSAITLRDPGSATPADVIERIDIVEQ